MSTDAKLTGEPYEHQLTAQRVKGLVLIMPPDTTCKFIGCENLYVINTPPKRWDIIGWWSLWRALRRMVP